MTDETQTETDSETDIYAPPDPEEVARVIAEIESGAYDETLRQARLAYNRKFPHRKMDVGYGLKPRSDRRNTDTEDEGLTNQHGQPTTEAPGYPPKEKHD